MGDHHQHEHHDHEECDHEDGHHHDHGCGHSHGLGHSHAPKDFGRAFAVGTILNSAYVVVQVVYGLLAHSLALLADAGHNLGDVLGLLLAWWASHLVKTRPTERRTYGLGRSFDPRGVGEWGAPFAGSGRDHVGGDPAFW